MPRRPRSLQELLDAHRQTLKPPTTAALARVLGVDQSTVSRWLRGYAPGWEQADRIARLLGMTRDEVEALIVAMRRRTPTGDDRLDRIEERLDDNDRRLDTIERELRRRK